MNQQNLNNQKITESNNNTSNRHKKNIEKFINEALAIEARDAKEAGALGFMARALVQATMPHKRVAGNEFTRKNGFYTLTMLAPQNIGLPYGTIPRLLMAWITTEAVLKRSQELILGHSLSTFMKELGLIPSGGRWGSIIRLRDQAKRLFSSSISCGYNDTQRISGLNMQVIEKYDLWWQPKHPEQMSLWESTLTLGKNFYEEIINHPIPLDLDALKALKRSPLAIDIYCWLTYRMSYLKHKTEISWWVLQTQFGSDYDMSSQGKRDFKKAFLREFRKVYTIYSGLNIDHNSKGLILKQSRSHILPKIACE